MSYARVLSPRNMKARATMARHPNVRILVFSQPCLITCPCKGICASGCYADMGRQACPDAARAYAENFAMTCDGSLWDRLRAELDAFNYVVHENRQQGCIRIHDSGDFFTKDYTVRWVELAREYPDIIFYTYSKRVKLFQGLTLPDNFRVTLSYGGIQDRWIRRDTDAHAIVIESDGEIPAGYVDGSKDEIHAINGTRKIAIRYHGYKSRAFTAGVAA